MFKLRRVLHFPPHLSYFAFSMRPMSASAGSSAAARWSIARFGDFPPPTIFGRVGEIWGTSPYSSGSCDLKFETLADLELLVPGLEPFVEGGRTMLPFIDVFR
jgi:hypothetical protein